MLIQLKRWEKIAIAVTVIIVVPVLLIRITAPEVFGIPPTPVIDRSPISISMTSLIYQELEERLNISPERLEEKSPEEIEKINEELENVKYTLASFSQSTIVSAHKLFNRFFWPKDETMIIPLKQLKQEFTDLEIEWQGSITEIEKFRDIPAVEAYIVDVNKAFAEVRKASAINRKPLVVAFTIFRDLESIWAGGANPPPYGVTFTEKALREVDTQGLAGYTYDEQTGRYVNETTGIWYIIENGYRVIPAEQYFDPKVSGISRVIGIEARPNTVWELSEVREITIQPEDNLINLISHYFMYYRNKHFRMNSEWYAKQVLELNNITDPNLIRTGNTLKIPIYIDNGS